MTFEKSFVNLSVETVAATLGLQQWRKKSCDRLGGNLKRFPQDVSERVHPKTKTQIWPPPRKAHQSVPPIKSPTRRRVKKEPRADAFKKIKRGLSVFEIVFLICLCVCFWYRESR